MKTKTYRSPMFYVGDKYKLINEIKSYFPSKINNFVEPFLGGGTVFMNIEAKNYLLNDIDSNVINLHKFLNGYKKPSKRDLFFDECLKLIDHYGLSKSFSKDIVPAVLKEQYKKTYYAKFNNIGYRKLKDDYNSSTSKDEISLYLLLIYGFNRMLRFNAKGQFNIPAGNVDFNKNVRNALLDYFRLVNEKKVKYYNNDFCDFFGKIDLNSDDLIYLDPPYLITFSEYNKIWNDTKEEQLLDMLDTFHNLNYRFAISNVTKYKGRTNKIFLKWMKKYNSKKITSNYISYHDNTNKEFEEVLVFNY